MKYIFVTGGVVSGLGKGITAASLGRLLKARGYKVTMQKLDPYLNIDPGTMNPIQHGEVFVTDDGAETDLDLGHYERFIDENLSQESNVTSGRVYWHVLEKERRGDYHGGTVQVIPHITNEFIHEIQSGKDDCDFALVEIGGTVGDMESLAILEAARQFAMKFGRANCLFLHVTLVPYLAASKEQKTKPTQNSVKDLLSLGIQPDVIVLRSERPLEEGIKNKIALFCNVPETSVIENLDLDYLYEVPLALESEGLAEVVCNYFGVPSGVPELTDWKEMVDNLSHPVHHVTIAIIGKYVKLRDAYLSVSEALTHGGIPSRTQVELKWIDSELVTDENAAEFLAGVDGILVPGGFGMRGIEGKISACRHARENGIPYFGICLGMQIALIESARNVAGLVGANSAEFEAETPYPVVDLMPDQRSIDKLGGTMRLGKYPCHLEADSKAWSLYKHDLITERHRHRYEVNNDYIDILQRSMKICGKSPDGHIVEMIEIPNHPFFIGCQFHPEFKSRPNRPHPLFRGFIEASLARQGVAG